MSAEQTDEVLEGLRGLPRVLYECETTEERVEFLIGREPTSDDMASVLAHGYIIVQLLEDQ